ncbi:ParA family protein [Leptospira kirschneri]|uniref:CobQ/CobB/MinD/ParA nucleotide binding domain protein n=1 Tax=Leptospira kirschneri str. H1 TaxID=1049966 RepID=A0A0E2AYI8_9LEPT|nr:ParA family protein [Leptospira kirschneri]EKO14002.1 CobQ/CobB/MinD/ParA nucleotide binding domain protein [Leptospira kirschneri str. H1]UML82321.1 ParA family protein [Leptospira kirschneri]
MKIITITNIKGGTGKSTSAVHLSVALGRRGKTLSVDMDQQGDLTEFFFPDESPESFDQANAYTVLKAETTLMESVRSSHGIDILPSVEDLSELTFQIAKDFSLIQRLKRVLRASHYDFIIIDTPGSISPETISSYIAADIILVPIIPAKWAIRRVNQVLKKVLQAKEFEGTNISKVLILPMSWGKSQKQIELLETIRSISGLEILEPIPFSTSIKDRTESNVLLQEGKPAWIAFDSLAEVLLK